MKKAYWFVLAFVVWCVICSLWYLFDVNGVLNSDKNHFNATTRFVAIAEILFMLLGACLLGFTIAWLLKAEEISAFEVSFNQLESENETIIKSKEEIANQLQLVRNKQNSDSSVFKLRIAELNHEKADLQKRLEQEESVLQKLKIEKAEKKWLIEQKNSQDEELIKQIHELEVVRKSLEQTNSLLKEEIKQLQITKEDKNQVSHHPFVKPLHNEHKDDLTKIRGIGPFIEKRLNMLGIYNFQQLSELDSDMIERVGAAIEFFPGRIARENWIGQARSLSLKN
jgi:predicted flap endonuclease-1-like 5' DNA nuclease